MTAPTYHTVWITGDQEMASLDPTHIDVGEVLEMKQATAAVKSAQSSPKVLSSLRLPQKQTSQNGLPEARKQTSLAGSVARAPANDFKTDDREFPPLGERVPEMRHGQSSPTSKSTGEDDQQNMSLEERLRGMILKNANSFSSNQADTSHIYANPVFPPHMQGASVQEKEAFMYSRMHQNFPARSGSYQPSSGPSNSQQMFQSPQGVSMSSQQQHANDMPMDPRGHVLQQGLPPVRDGTSSQQASHPSSATLRSFYGQFHQSQFSRNPQNQSSVQDQTRSHQQNYNSRNRSLFRPNPSTSGRPRVNPVHHSSPHPNTLPAHMQEAMGRQSDYLLHAASLVVAEAEIDRQELQEKEAFRASLEVICRNVIADFEESQVTSGKFNSNTVKLKCYGSLGSGYAVKFSDMDLILLSPLSQPSISSVESPIPRILEKRFLEVGLGARLLTRTRVPILKLCEKPSQDLLAALREERTSWDQRKKDGLEELKEQGHELPNGAEDSELGPADKQHAKTATEDPMASVMELTRLSQRPSEDLYAYYRRAKRLLTKVESKQMTTGSRKGNDDTNHSSELVVDAFIFGLRDKVLQERLATYISSRIAPTALSFEDIWVHAEGEEIALSWELRTIKEATDAKEGEGAGVVQKWRFLHTPSKAEHSDYDRILRQTWHKLKALPSPKLVSLSQRPGEKPEQYYLRAKEILDALGALHSLAPAPSETPARQTEMLKVARDRFVNGVHDDELRRYLQEYTAMNETASLVELSKQLQAEKQVYDYLRAAKKGLLSEEEQAVVKNYANLIRQYGALSSNTDVIALYERLKEIHDPCPANRKETHPLVNELPKTGFGIQCDINFSNEVALHNTLLLRCYNHCDPRVRPLVLAVKTWTKRRQINSPYHGTLSSYGYVLMVLHFLINVATPPVLPNLQLAWRPPQQGSWSSALNSETIVNGCDVRFWRNEEEINSLAGKGMLTHNKENLGSLLRGFFEYYSHQGPQVIGGGFFWGRDVISIRTKGGLITKQSKGWTGAKTTVGDVAQSDQHKNIRHRYLLAIEDPFELDHNVARVVAHNGIVAIRTELRRAWRIILSCSKLSGPEEDLFQALDEPQDSEKHEPGETVGLAAVAAE